MSRPVISGERGDASRPCICPGVHEARFDLVRISYALQLIAMDMLAFLGRGKTLQSAARMATSYHLISTISNTGS